MKNQHKEKPIIRPKERVTEPSKEKPIKLPSEKPITPPKEPFTDPSREKPTRIPKEPNNTVD